MGQVNMLQNPADRDGRSKERGNSRANLWLILAAVLMGIVVGGARAYGLDSFPLTSERGGEWVSEAYSVCDAPSLHRGRETEIIRAFKESLENHIQNPLHIPDPDDVTSHLGPLLGPVKKTYYWSAFLSVYEEMYGEPTRIRDEVVQFKKTILSEAISVFDKGADLIARGVPEHEVRRCRIDIIGALGEHDIFSADRSKSSTFLERIFKTTRSDYDMKPSILDAISQGGIAGTPEGLSILRLGLADENWYVQGLALDRLEEISSKITLQEAAPLWQIAMEKGDHGIKARALHFVVENHGVEMIPIISMAIKDPVFDKNRSWILREAQPNSDDTEDYKRAFQIFRDGLRGSDE